MRPKRRVGVAANIAPTGAYGFLIPLARKPDGIWATRPVKSKRQGKGHLMVLRPLRANVCFPPLADIGDVRFGAKDERRGYRKLSEGGGGRVSHDGRARMSDEAISMSIRAQCCPPFRFEC
jgi:hypothetical protein